MTHPDYKAGAPRKEAPAPVQTVTTTAGPQVSTEVERDLGRPAMSETTTTQRGQSLVLKYPNSSITVEQSIDNLLALCAHSMALQTRLDHIVGAWTNLDFEDRRLIGDKHPRFAECLVRAEADHQVTP
ncbi:hypothetical protein BH23ACT5_BH23ACT5_09930 [soil metagenome]